MAFRIAGLDPRPFAHLFGMSDVQLHAHNARRVVADCTPGYPDRIQLRDALPGQSLILLNYTHQPARSPYQASHAIYVLEGASERYDEVDQVPPAFRPRTLSLRAFDADDCLIDADLVEGREVEGLIARLLANPKVAYLHAHYARPGCFAARIDRL